MGDRESKYVTSSRPVNLRTAMRDAAPPDPPVNTVLRDRIAAAQARARLGSPLAEQVRSRAPDATRLQPTAIAAALFATACGAAALFALIQGLPLAGMAAGAGVIAGCFLVWHAQRRPPRAPAGEAPPLFDHASLQALDRMLAEVAVEIPEHIALQLAEFNRMVVRLSGQAAVADGEFTLEDRMYITECVRRYLPDTLQAYLAIPSDRRDAVLLEGNRSAADLLAQQLELLRGELEQREARLARSAADSLLRQQRFLQAKRKP
ncbi:hypothetical protein [Caenimonas aquaedulcis]|uniref:Uncharacterized protein n=1 Tax=Caenimonas aquaedulcis TaxID=2793270 RepID=A0A931MHJ0_9BURK|nr:hypothetical protein [Caenimonas aquaedulcis]MBG9388789.1 hypothetical protein [Caenimonas aquaedulcis]